MGKRKQPLNQITLLDQIEEQKYTDEQRDFIFFDKKMSVILSAVAGSGKTFSCVERLKELLRRGVDPKRIIFFSFTNAAVDELKERIGNKDIKVTTIHKYCNYILRRAGKYKDITNFFDFVAWYQQNFKPSKYATEEEKKAFYEQVSDMYENHHLISGNISAYKLQKADGVKAKLPDFFFEYERYQKEKKARDFSDMLIEVHDLLKQNKWLKVFKDKYDYIFIDEFQDTSTIQLKVLLALNAKYYYMIGDRYQSIFLFSGVNYDNLVSLLESRRKVKQMTLTYNFRSGTSIVENENNYTNLKARPFNDFEGSVDSKIIFTIKELKEILDNNEEVAILVRTNRVIKQMEELFLSQKYPMKYINFITPMDIKNYKEGNVHAVLKGKINRVLPYFNNNEDELFEFIHGNSQSKKFITTIHKSKGLEFDTCVVVNSIAPEILDENNMELPPAVFKKVSFSYDEKDRDEQNVHYVAVSRPKNKLYYMVIHNGFLELFMFMKSVILEAIKNSLLQEVSIDMLKTQFVDSGQLSQEAFDEIVKASNGKSAYATWLAKMVEKNTPKEDEKGEKQEPSDERKREDERFAPAIKQEDIYKFSSYFKLFERHKNRFKFKDINQYKAGKAFNSNREALNSFLNDALEVEKAEMEKARKKEKISGEGEITENFVSPDDILKLEAVGIEYLGMLAGKNGAKYQVFKLSKEKAETKEAHKLYNSILMRCKDRHLGAEIKLCTAPNYDTYKSYIGRDDLFVFFNLNDPKSPIQMHYKDNQFMDKDDVSVLN